MSYILSLLFEKSDLDMFDMTVKPGETICSKKYPKMEAATNNVMIAPKVV